MTNGKFSCKQPLQKEIKRRLFQKKGAELIRSLGIVFCVCRLLNDKFRSFHSSIRNHLNHIYAFLH